MAKKMVRGLALSSLLRATAAFNHGAGHASRVNQSRSLRGRITRSAATISDDPSLTSRNTYELLKRSRPIRIHARIPRPNGEGDSSSGSQPATKKVVHFQRHAQGTHNEIYKQWTERTGEPLDLSETDPTKNPLLLPDVIDAPLTQKGRDQCSEQRPAASALGTGIELVICSPLVRALETAHITWEHVLPRNSDVQWIAHEDIREEFGTLLCNQRRPLSETMAAFPEVDYTHMHSSEEDVLWMNHVERTADGDGVPKRESIEDMSHRAYDFLVNFLRCRPEKEIVVVGHSAWFLAMTGAVLDLGEDEAAITPMFGQAEIRSLELRFLEQAV